MATESRSLFQLLKESVNGFSEDDCPTMAAALSYYTVFSLPPLLVLLLSILPQAPTFPQVPKTSSRASVCQPRVDRMSS